MQDRQQTDKTNYLLFGKGLLSIEKAEKARELGEMIRRGEEKDIEYVLSQIEEDPRLLDLKVTTKGLHDIELKNKNLVEIAFMEGDVDLKPGITEDKKHGLVERLAAVGKLSKERVADDSKCVNSAEAKAENEARIKRYVDIMKKFGVSIGIGKNLDLFSNENIKKNAIAQLEKDLFDERKNYPVNAGLVCDPKILQKTAEYITENSEMLFDGLGGVRRTYNISIFFIYGFTMLIGLLSERDHSTLKKTGIPTLLNCGVIPARSLNRSDDLIHLADFLQFSAGPGISAYAQGTIWLVEHASDLLKAYLQQKQLSYDNKAVEYLDQPSQAPRVC